MTFDAAFVAIIIQLIILEGMLSVDNAAVLAAMVRHLPNDERVPWPRLLTGLGRRLDPALGHRRAAALKAGLLGAYAGRIAMLFLASFIIRNHWLRLLGAAYLLYLAGQHLWSRRRKQGEEEEGAFEERVEGRGFWGTVLAVELADLAFSLDNVVAAVALSDHIVVVIIGVALGILTMRIAAGLFVNVVERIPELELGAYVLVGAIGLELILEDFGLIHFNEWVKFAINIGILLAAVTTHFLRKPAEAAAERD